MKNEYEQFAGPNDRIEIAGHIIGIRPAAEDMLAVAVETETLSIDVRARPNSSYQVTISESLVHLAWGAELGLGGLLVESNLRIRCTGGEAKKARDFFKKYGIAVEIR